MTTPGDGSGGSARELDGAAAARTVLAARRSALSGLGVGVVALGVALRSSSAWPVPAAAVVTCCCALAAVLLTPTGPKGFGRSGSGPGDASPSPWSVLVVAASVPVLLAVFGTAVALTG